jgi:3D (Asp-Asp-Asp) domain-containing protein
MAAARLLLLLTIPLCTQAAQSPANGRYIATAYSVSGKTASGEYTQRHIVAADTAILPIGSVIKIKHAGRYSGEYVVADTGEKIIGRKLDIFIPSTLACKKFGRKRVSVTVIQLGDGTHESAKQSVDQVKQDVKKDVDQGVAGNAATEQDLAKPNQPNTGATHPSTTKPSNASGSHGDNPPE